MNGIGEQEVVSGFRATTMEDPKSLPRGTSSHSRLAANLLFSFFTILKVIFNLHLDK